MMSREIPSQGNFFERKEERGEEERGLQSSYFCMLINYELIHESLLRTPSPLSPGEKECAVLLENRICREWRLCSPRSTIGLHLSLTCRLPTRTKPCLVCSCNNLMPVVTESTRAQSLLSVTMIRADSHAQQVISGRFASTLFITRNCRVFTSSCEL